MLSFLPLLSGPLNALVRYGLTAAGGLMVGRGFITEEAWQYISGGLLIMAPTWIGTALSTQKAKIVTVADIPGVSLGLPNGALVRNSTQAIEAVK